MKQQNYKSAIITKSSIKDGIGNRRTNYRVFIAGQPSYNFDSIKSAKTFIDSKVAA